MKELKEKAKKIEKDRICYDGYLGLRLWRILRWRCIWDSFIAIGESYIEEEKANTEVSILELKENLLIFFKRQLTSLIIALIDDLYEQTSDRDRLFSVIVSLKFNYIDPETYNNDIEKKNCTLKDQVGKLDNEIWILSLKF